MPFWIYFLVFFIDIAQYYADLEAEIAEGPRACETGLVSPPAWLCPLIDTEAQGGFFHSEEPSLQGSAFPGKDQDRNGAEVGSVAMPLLHEDGQGGGQSVRWLSSSLGTMSRYFLHPSATSTCSAVRLRGWLGRCSMAAERLWMAGWPIQITAAANSEPSPEAAAAEIPAQVSV